MAANTASQVHVIVLNDYCYVQGGASRVAIDGAVGLAELGVNVTFVGAVGPACDELKTASLKLVDLDQVELSSFPENPRVAAQGLWNPAAYRTMKTVLASHDPRSTVVHVHGYTKSLSSSPVRVATDNGFEVVCTLHDFFAGCPNGAFFNFVENKPCLLRGLSLSCLTTNCDKRHAVHKIYRVARSLVQRHVGHFPGGVRNYIALSNRSMELLRPYLPRDARMSLLENPIDIERQPAVDVAARMRLVAVGRLDTEKGTKVLVDAARAAGARLTLVGDGPWRSYAEAYAGCEVTGWLTRSQVIATLDQARCLVFPSLWYETYGLVVAEAAARGVPSIVSDITAAAERVQDGVTGWHARAGDADDLARCLKLIGDDETVRRAGLAAYAAFWIDPPTLHRHCVALLDLYREFLTSRRPSSLP